MLPPHLIRHQQSAPTYFIPGMTDSSSLSSDLLAIIKWVTDGIFYLIGVTFWLSLWALWQITKFTVILAFLVITGIALGIGSYQLSELLNGR